MRWAPGLPGASGVCAQLRVPGDLLEQPPPHARGCLSRERRDAVGQPESPLLALAGPFHHRVDERAALPVDPDSYLRHRLARGRDRVLHPAEPRCSTPKASNPGSAPPIGSDLKGKISPLLYCLGIGLAFADRWISLAVYVAVALIWLVPDRRVERRLTTLDTKPTGISAPGSQKPIRPHRSIGKSFGALVGGRLRPYVRSDRWLSGSEAWPSEPTPLETFTTTAPEDCSSSGMNAPSTRTGPNTFVS